MSGKIRPEGKRYSLKSQVDSFISADETDVEFIREYLWRILDRVQEFAKATQRSFIGSVLLAVLFELLNRNLVSETSAGGVRLAKINFIKPFIPIAIGYLWLRISVLLQEGKILTEAYYCITEIKFPGLHSSTIDDFLVPTTTPTAAEVPIRFTSNPRAISFIRGVEVVFYFSLPVAFSVYAFIQLFGSSGFSDVTIWFSFALTVPLLVGGYICALSTPNR